MTELCVAAKYRSSRPRTQASGERATTGWMAVPRRSALRLAAHCGETEGRSARSGIVRARARRQRPGLVPLRGKGASMPLHDTMRSLPRGISQRKSGKFPIGAYRAAVLCEQVSRDSRCEVFSVQFSVRADSGDSQTGVRPYTKNDGLARRWPSGDVGRCCCTSPDLPRRRSPTSSAWSAPWFAAILRSLRDTWRSGDSPDLEEARFTQMAKDEVQGRKDWSSTRHTRRWEERSVPRRRRNPATKGGSTARLSMDTVPH
jgi:hypothetical protein